MAYNESKRKANNKYDAKNMITYTVKYQKSIYEMVEKAIIDSGINRNKWTTTAILEKLERDGYLQKERESEQAHRAGNDAKIDIADDNKLPWEV